MTTRRSPSRFVLLAPCLLALACGGGGGSGGDPDTPERQPVASHALSGGAEDVVVLGTTAYVSVSTWGPAPSGKVIAVDVSDPLLPAHRAEIDLGGFLHGVGSSGGSLFALHDAPWSGRRLSELVPETLAATGRGLDLAGSYGRLAVEGGHAFLPSWDGPAGMVVVDLATLSVVAQYGGAYGTTQVFASGDRAYLSGATLALDVVDVTTVSSPHKLGSLANDVGEAPASVIVRATPAGMRAALGCGPLGVAQVSLTDEASPTLLGFEETGGFAGTIALAGDLALVAVGTGVLVIDATDPDAPFALARLRSSGYANDVAVSGRYAYVVGHLPSMGPPSSSSLDVFDLAEWQ